MTGMVRETVAVAMVFYILPPPTLFSPYPIITPLNQLHRTPESISLKAEL